MSRGLSRIQAGIVGRLRGDWGLVFTGRNLTTGELYQELLAKGLVATECRKVGVFTVRRACVSLLRRGLVSGEYTVRGDPPNSVTICWRAEASDQPKAEG